MRTAIIERSLAVLLALAIVVSPELAAAQQSTDQNAPPPSQTTTTPTPQQTTPQTQTPAQQPPATTPQTNPQTPQTNTTQPPATSDPNQQPELMPKVNEGSQNLPTAPEPQQPTTQTPSTTTQTQPQTTAPQTNEPVGTAAAEKAKTVGGIASRPTGIAMAPAKQRQVRSWLIKLGAVAAGGAALGLVFALSKSSPSRPPGTP